ncbi:MAG: hypothetical protein JKX68_02625, partial [Flavobacteriales bacterium]|nr:hypothetical protein [Flavobacteriales bacterium]
AKDSLKCFNQGELNYVVTRESEFRSLLYAGDIKDAGKVIKNMVNEYKDSIDEHRLSTHRYFLACFHFANGQFRKCNQLLADAFEFKNDRTGWEFNARVLGVMASLEQNKIEIAQEKYYSLFRLFERNQEDKKALSPRNKIILELIKKWIKAGGNKSIAKMKGTELLAKLSLPKNEWDPLGSELIPFDKWMASKV